MFLAASRPNRVTIDLEAIRSNLSKIRKSIGPRCHVMVSVKGDAYGYGAAAVAQVAQESGVVGAAAGDLTTAIHLRNSGFTGALLVYPGCVFTTTELDAAAEHGIALTTVDAHSAEHLARLTSRPIEVFAKVDVGHGRLGVRPEDVPDLVRLVLAQPRLRLMGLITHLYAPLGGTEHVLQWQLDRFSRAMDLLAADGHLPPIRIAASSAVLDRYQKLHLDSRLTHADPGRLPLGLTASGSMFSGHVRHAIVSITSRVVQVKEPEVVPPSDLTPPYTQRQGMRVGIVPLGKVDGFDCVAPPSVLIRGEVATILRIWTEHTAVDVTQIEDCMAGDEVVALGTQGGRTIEVADLTSAHSALEEMDLLMRLGPTVPRRYLHHTEVS